jgi:DNA-binding response OmpR family regulator
MAMPQRAPPNLRMRYLFEDYALDTDRRELCRRGDVVRLEPQAFDLLEYLIRNRDRVVRRDDLIAAIWGGRIVSESAMTTRTTQHGMRLTIPARRSVSSRLCLEGESAL